MKKKTSILGRMIALLLAVPLMIGLAPLPAHAVSAAHFTDVPSSHWAYQYVERAYKDHAILGMGGEPEMGTGIFRPNDSMTYGQFLTMLTRAFYPKERERVGEDGPWYAPALQVAVNRQLNFNTLEGLEHMVDTPINRYNAAWILVRILEDKGVVLPTDQERAVAAAQIGDWDTLLEDEYWRYFVSSIYALGIITGVDQSGAFHGTDYITRASAAVLYTKMADKVQRSGNDPKAFGITFEGDWSAASKEYREALEEEFYTVYPRLWARFGTANTARHISLFLVPREEIDGNDGITYTGFDDTKYETTASIKIANVYLDDWRHTAAIFAHELTHAATGVTLREIKSENHHWFFECLADYGLFRYAAWSDERYMWLQESYYQPEDEALRTWEYEAYTDTHWFFAYIDEYYPTTNAGYGLLDSILLAILNGQITTDGGKAQDDPNLNAVVQEVTGYDSLEALRQRYVGELDAGTWTFDGFADFADNYITEDLPGVPNPTYLTAADLNLCANAYTYGVSGQASHLLAANNLVDGDLSTKWEASKSDVKDPDELRTGVQQEVYITLNKAMIFDSYTLYHEGSQGNSKKNTKARRIKYYDSETEKWVQLDQVKNNTEDVTTRTFEPVTARYLLLEILDPSGTGDGTVRLYELEIHRKGNSE